MEIIRIGNQDYECEKIVRYAHKDEYKRIIKKIIFNNINLKNKNEDQFIEEFYSNINTNTIALEFEGTTIKCQTANISLIRDRALCIEIIEDIIPIK